MSPGPPSPHAPGCIGPEVAQAAEQTHRLLQLRTPARTPVQEELGADEAGQELEDVREELLRIVSSGLEN